MDYEVSELIDRPQHQWRLDPTNQTIHLVVCSRSDVDVLRAWANIHFPFRNCTWNVDPEFTHRGNVVNGDGCRDRDGYRHYGLTLFHAGGSRVEGDDLSIDTE